MSIPQKKLGKGIIIFPFAVLILVIIILLNVDNKKENLTIPTISNENILNKAGTIDGYDPASGATIDPVCLWSEYKNRSLKIIGKIIAIHNAYTREVRYITLTCIIY